MGTSPSGDGLMQIVPPVMIMRTRDSGYLGAGNGSVEDAAEDAAAGDFQVEEPGPEPSGSLPGGMI